MFDFNEFHEITGHLQIVKVFKNGKEEIVFDDHNTIVSGMGVGLSLLFSLSGATQITEFQIDRFQLGTSGNGVTETSAVFELSGPVSSGALYTGDSSLLQTVSATQIANGADVADQPFALISTFPARVNDTSVRYTLVLDEDAGNDVVDMAENATPFNEAGLFMKNPQGRSSDASILVAYRKHSAIEKTSDFALVYRWTINW